jgi:ParB/RepB/Spo0J family partition protein
MAKAKTKETTIAEESATQAENISGAEFREIPLAKIRTSPTNPRKHFPEEAINEMAESIKLKGVMQPILVRPAAHIPEDELEIVAGECRYRASVIAGMDTIPAIVRQLTDLEALELQVMENLHRNNLTALEEAFGFKQLLDKSQDLVGFTIEDLAAKIGKSRTYIYDSLKLTELPEKAITAFNSGDLDRSTALLVARLEPEDQDTAIGELVNREDDQPKFSYREAKAKIDEIVQTSAQKREAEAKLEQARALVAQMEAEGKTVVLLDTVEKRQEWTKYGFHNLTYNTKSGFTTPNRHIYNLGDLEAFEISHALTESEYPEATYLVSTEAEVKIVLNYQAASDLITQKFEAGQLSHLPERDKTPSKHALEMQNREQAMDKARNDRSTLFRAIFQKLSEKPLEQLPLRDLLAIQAQMQFENLSPDQYGIVMEVYGRQEQDEADFIREMTVTAQVADLIRLNYELLACMETDPDWDWNKQEVQPAEIQPVILKALDIYEEQILVPAEVESEKTKAKTKGKAKTEEAVSA